MATEPKKEMEAQNERIARTKAKVEAEWAGEIEAKEMTKKESIDRLIRCLRKASQFDLASLPPMI